MSDVLKEITAAGVSIWLDDISRNRLQTGNLAELIKDLEVRGVTSNPTIFAAALAKGDAYTAQIKDLAVRKVSVEEASRMITTFDIRWAADVLKPVYDATDSLDGRVSIEVDPRLARKTEPTIAEAKQLWWLVDRPNILIKIPATLEGLPAITAVLAEGISVNVTLIFSLERYGEVIDAYLAGLEQAVANGHDIATIASVASDGGEAFTWMLIFAVVFFVPQALLFAELGTAFPQKLLHRPVFTGMETDHGQHGSRFHDFHRLRQGR